MKSSFFRTLAYAISTIVIVVMGLSIIFSQLGIAIPKRNSNASSSSSSQNAAPSSKPVPGPASPASSPPKPGSSNGTFAGSPVQAVRISTGSLSRYTKIYGDVVSRTQVAIFPDKAGKLLEKKVATGSRVAKGDVIAFIDPSRLGETYLPNPVVSTVSGTVLSIPVNEGDTVATNTVIATVGDVTNIKISAAIPERYIAGIHIGTNAEVSFDALPGLIFTASVDEISPVVDPVSRTLDLSFDFSKRDKRVLVGMLATLKIAVESRQNVVLVPRSAVTITSSGAYIFVIKDGGKVEKRAITLGLEGEDAFEVLKGLSPGEQVVTLGKDTLFDGSRVRVITASQPEDGGVSR